MDNLNHSLRMMEQNDVENEAREVNPTDHDLPPCSSQEPNFPPDKPNVWCEHCGTDNRNLVVCIDGTPHQKWNTNVLALYNIILKEAGDNQRAIYKSGIGTGFEQTVLDAYRWLSNNYEQGDCIFLFGFSRGAYQVRVLSAMIEKVGLVHKEHELEIRSAYELYADLRSGEPTGNPPMSRVEWFKRTYSNENVKVHFVGAWDTVSPSSMFTGKKSILPGTIDGMRHVCYFGHALALDEQGVMFLPEYAYGGLSQEDMPNKAKGEHGAPSAPDKASPHNSSTKYLAIFPQTKEVWFPGTHSDIGRKSWHTNVGRAMLSLRWMVLEARALGLRTEHEVSYERPNIMRFLTWRWLFIEYLPIKRRPHHGLSRKILPGQKIHVSSLWAEDKSYIPRARPPYNSISFWDVLHDKWISGECNEWVELGSYEVIEKMVDQLLNGGDDAALRSLDHRDIPNTARQIIYNSIVEALSSTKLTPEVKHRFLHSAMDVLKNISQDGSGFKLSPFIKVRLLLADLQNSVNDDHQKTAQEFMARFADPCWTFYIPSAQRVWSDGNHVASATNDNVVQIWDAETGTVVQIQDAGKSVGKELRGHTNRVTSVAFSSGDEYIVSGSFDDTVRIWDAKTGKLVGKPLQGHTNTVMSVAISSDGKRVASGSNDNTVRIWDAERGKSIGEPLRGHTDAVMSVAISSDGKCIVSGSNDNTVRIWNAETRESVGEPLRGHTDAVMSVAISSDGKHIVSGSNDNTVRIWNAETRESVGEPLRGHTDWVMSVAFSSDGKNIVSSSCDEMVRIWDVGTGTSVGGPLQENTEWVRAVAFSPDDKCVISCSSNGTVRIWDLESLNYRVHRR